MDPSRWMLCIANYLWFVMLKVQYVRHLKFKPTIDAPASWTARTNTSLPATSNPANRSATFDGADAVHTITYIRPAQKAEYGLILYEHPPAVHDGLLIFLQSYLHHAILILLALAVFKCAPTLWRWACAIKWDLPRLHWRGKSTHDVDDTSTTPDSQDLKRPTEDKQALQDLTQQMSSWRERAKAAEKNLESVKASLNASVRRESDLQATVQQQAADASAQEAAWDRQLEDAKANIELEASRKALKQVEGDGSTNITRGRAKQALETTISALQDKKARLAQETSELEGKFHELTAESEQVGRVKNDKAALAPAPAGDHYAPEPDIQQVAAKKKELEDEISGLKRNRDDLENEKQKLGAEKGDLDDKTSRLVNQCKDLQSRVEALSTSEVELSGNISKLTAEHKGLRSQTEALTTSEKELSGKLLKLDSERRLQESRTKELSEEKNALASSITELKEQRKGLEKQSKKLSDTANALTTQISMLNDEREGFEKQNKRLSDTTKALTENISRLEGQRNDAQSQTTALCESEAALKANVQKLANQRKDLEVQNDTLLADKSRLETRISELAVERHNVEELVAGKGTISAATSTPQIADNGPTSTPDFAVQRCSQSTTSSFPTQLPFNQHDQPMGPSGDAAGPDKRSISGEANLQQLASDRPASHVDSAAQRYDQGPGSGPAEDMDVDTPQQQLFFQRSSSPRPPHLFAQNASSAHETPFAFGFLNRDETTPRFNKSGLPNQQLSSQPSAPSQSSLQQPPHRFGQDASSSSSAPFAFDFMSANETTPKIDLSGFGGKLFKLAAKNADAGRRGDGKSGCDNQDKLAATPRKPLPPAESRNVSDGGQTSHTRDKPCSHCGEILDMAEGHLCSECDLGQRLERALENSDYGSESAGSGSEDGDSGIGDEGGDAPANGDQELDEDAGDGESRPHHSVKKYSDSGDEMDASEERDLVDEGNSGEENEDDYDRFADDLCANQCGEKLESEDDISRGYCPGCWDERLKARFEDERPKMPLKTRKR